MISPPQQAVPWAINSSKQSDVKQAGSYVGPDKLLFDFTHRGRVPAEELVEIERLVNARVAEDSPVGEESDA